MEDEKIDVAPQVEHKKIDITPQVQQQDSAPPTYTEAMKAESPEILPPKYQAAAEAKKSGCLSSQHKLALAGSITGCAAGLFATSKAYAAGIIALEGLKATFIVGIAAGVGALAGALLFLLAAYLYNRFTTTYSSGIVESPRVKS